MIDFIIENKEWLFSGIGVTALTVIFLLIRHVFQSKKAHQSKPTKQKIDEKEQVDTTDHKDNSIGYSMHPTPKEVADEINSTPLFQQKDAEKNYIGIKVRWDVSLSLVHSGSNNNVELTCEFKGYSRFVNIKTNLEKYPKIKILKRGQKITVYGEIIKIDASGPVVDEHKLEFH